MRMIRTIFATALAASVALPGRAQEEAPAGVVVLEPWTRATAASAPAAGYMALRNAGSQPERLLSASSPLARNVELHETRMDGDVTRMRQPDKGLLLPPGSMLRLDSGGPHFMLVGPARAFRRSGRMPMPLRFEHGGEVNVEIQVEAPGARAAPPMPAIDVTPFSKTLTTSLHVSETAAAAAVQEVPRIAADGVTPGCDALRNHKLKGPDCRALP
jgi:hypothetical protein